MMKTLFLALGSILFLGPIANASELYFQIAGFETSAKEVFEALPMVPGSKRSRATYDFANGYSFGIECAKNTDGYWCSVLGNLTRIQPTGVERDGIIKSSELMFKGKVAELIFDSLNVPAEMRMGATVKTVGPLTCYRVVRPELPSNCTLKDVTVLSEDVSKLPDEEAIKAFEAMAAALGI